jgi:hypothetical protein
MNKSYRAIPKEAERIDNFPVGVFGGVLAGIHWLFALL